MSKLTLVEALNMSRDLWLWLSEHPFSWKYDYPKWEEYNLAHMNANCPLCEYYRNVVHVDKNKGKGKCRGCCLNTKKLCAFNEKDSAYDKWNSHTSDQGSIQNALKIYRAIDKKYQKLLEESKGIIINEDYK